MTVQAIRTTTRFAYENTFRREMLRHLTPAETKVMVYIMDKTLGWMKDRERISMYEIKDGKGNNQGTGIARSTVIKCVQALARKGVIFIQHSCKKLGTLMVLNLEWGIDNVLKEAKQAKKQGSKLSVSDDSSTNVGLHMSENTTTGSTAIGLPINKRNKPSNKLDCERQAFESSTSDIDQYFQEDKQDTLKPVAKSLSVSDAISSGLNKNSNAVAERKERNLKKARDGLLNVSTLESAFEDGIRASDEKVYLKSWTMKDRGQAKHFIKAIKMPPVTLLDFIHFCGQYWKQIIRDKFQWADSELSTMPNIGFLLKYSDQFLYAYNNKDKIANAEAKSSIDGRVARMVDRGMTEEEALADIDTKMAKRGKTRTRSRVAPANPIDQFHRHISDTKVDKSMSPKTRDYMPEDTEVKPIHLDEIGEWK